jgi:hypothetical protein
VPNDLALPEGCDFVIADPPFGIKKGKWDANAPSQDEWEGIFSRLMSPSSFMTQKFAVAVYCTPAMMPSLASAAIAEGASYNFQLISFIQDSRTGGAGTSSLAGHLKQSVLMFFFHKSNKKATDGDGVGDGEGEEEGGQKGGEEGGEEEGGEEEGGEEGGEEEEDEELPDDEELDLGDGLKVTSRHGRIRKGGGRDMFMFAFKRGSKELQEDESLLLAPFRFWPALLENAAVLSSVYAFFKMPGEKVKANVCQKNVEGALIHNL